MRSLKRIICVSLLLLLCIAPALPPARAAGLDLGELCDVTITLKDKSSNPAAPLSGAGITLYRVASARIEGWNIVYDAIYPFDNAGVDLGNLGSDAAGKLFAARNGAASTTKTTGADGTASFENLESGLYLVAQTGSVNRYYDISPFLLSAPMSDGTGWLYKIAAAPKTSPTPYQPPPPTPPEPTPTEPPEETPTEPPEPTETPGSTETPEPTETPVPGPTPDDGLILEPPPVPLDENGVPLGEWRWDPDLEEWILDEFPPLGDLNLPQTGQLRWPVPVMAGAGVTLFVSGWAVKRKRDRGA